MGLQRYRKSEILYREVLKQQSEDANCPEGTKLDTKYQLSRCLERQRRFLEATLMMQEVVEARERLLGREHPNTLEAKLALGELNLRRWLLYDAELLLKEAWDGLGKVENMAEAWCLTGKSYAECLFFQDRQQDAIQACAQVYRDAVRVLGKTHLTTQHCKNMMSQMRSKQVRIESDLDNQLVANAQVPDSRSINERPKRISGNSRDLRSRPAS